MHRLVGKDNFPADKKRGIFPHSLADQRIQIVPCKDKIRCHFFHAQVLQRHLHILLCLEKFALHFTRKRRILLLQKQPHRRNRRFDLMGPHGVILHHIAVFLLHLNLFFLKLPLVGCDDLLVIPRQKPVRLRKRFCFALRFGGKEC